MGAFSGHVIFYFFFLLKKSISFAYIAYKNQGARLRPVVVPNKSLKSTVLKKKTTISQLTGLYAGCVATFTITLTLKIYSDMNT